MKRLIYLFLFLLTIISCEKEERTNAAIIQNDLFDQVDPHSAINPLLPTGNSTQDTENLQAAIHSSILDSGGTLYLGEGTFPVVTSFFCRPSGVGIPKLGVSH